MKCPRCALDRIRSFVALRVLSLKRCLRRATPNSYFDSVTSKGVGDFLVRMSLSGKLKKYLN